MPVFGIQISTLFIGAGLAVWAVRRPDETSMLGLARGLIAASLVTAGVATMIFWWVATQS